MTITGIRWDDKALIQVLDGELRISGFVFEGDSMTAEEIGHWVLKWFEEKVRKDYSATKWISVEDRLPEKDAAYLIHAPSADPKKPFIHIAWFNPNSRLKWSLLPEVWIAAITHWMPLPEPPK